MSKKVEFFVVYEIDKPASKKPKHKKQRPERELLVIHIKPQLLEGLKGNDALRLVRAQEVFTERVWKKMTKKYGNLRKLKQPRFDELEVMTREELEKELARRKKKTWKYQGAPSHAPAGALRKRAS